MYICCILFLFVVPLTCLSCHVECTDDISVFTSEDSDSSSSSGSDTDAKAPQQNSGSKVLIYLFLIWILFRVTEVSIKFISFCWCEGYFKTLSQWLFSLSLSLSLSSLVYMQEKILPVDGLDKEKGKFCFIGVSVFGISIKPSCFLPTNIILWNPTQNSMRIMMQWYIHVQSPTFFLKKKVFNTFLLDEIISTCAITVLCCVSWWIWFLYPRQWFRLHLAWDLLNQLVELPIQILFVLIWWIAIY